MKYDLIIEFHRKGNFLDNRPNIPSEFRTDNWVGINDDTWNA